MKKQGDKFEAGDRAIVPGLGWGSVVEDDFSGLSPIKWVGDGGSFQWVGRYGVRDGVQVIYHANQGVIEIDTDEPVRAEDLKLDQPMQVGDYSGGHIPYANRHFAKFENGTLYCWSDGKTSHTANEDEITRWRHWRLPKAAPCP